MAGYKPTERRQNGCRRSGAEGKMKNKKIEVLLPKIKRTSNAA